MDGVSQSRRVALVTGVSRKRGIGAAIVSALSRSGWDVATTFWRPYDATMPWGSNPEEAEAILDEARGFSSQTMSLEADLSDTRSPARIFDAVEERLGPVTALVIAHCQSEDSDIYTTTVESFDLHFAINARATWLLVREFGARYRGDYGNGRIVAITSDHTAHNLPYGASEGAMDRIVLAASEEFRSLGITANLVNPGPTDTGWMTMDQKEHARCATPLGRVGLPQDCAHLVEFLCSAKGGWINGQLLFSDGGIR